MIVVCGESLVDLVPGGAGPVARPGGSPTNVAVGLGRLGVATSLVTRLANDHYGQLTRAHLTGSGVRLDRAVDTDRPSTVAAVRLDPDGSARYEFTVDGTATDGWDPARLPDLPDGAPLHVSGAFALGRPDLRATVEALLRRERGRRVLSFDPNPRPALHPDLETMRRWISWCDVVKVSAADLEWTVPGRPAAEVAAHWRRLGPAVVVVTRGADGAHAHGPAGVHDAPAPRLARLVDTIGAGDAFTSGLLAALDRAGRLTPDGLRTLPGPDLAAAVDLAQQVAARTCERVGADPPWTAELT